MSTSTTDLSGIAGWSSEKRHYEALKISIELVETFLKNGCEVEFEGVHWLLYNETGEVIASGTTLFQMIMNAGQESAGYAPAEISDA